MKHVCCALLGLIKQHCYINTYTFLYGTFEEYGFEIATIDWTEVYILYQLHIGHERHQCIGTQVVLMTSGMHKNYHKRHFGNLGWTIGTFTEIHRYFLMGFSGVCFKYNRTGFLIRFNQMFDLYRYS